jgi:hypothetical protein
MTNTGTHTHMSTHSYEYTYAHTIFMSISERLNRLDLEIYKVGHQNASLFTGTSSPTERIISLKFDSYVRPRIDLIEGKKQYSIHFVLLVITKKKLRKYMICDRIGNPD